LSAAVPTLEDVLAAARWVARETAGGTAPDAAFDALQARAAMAAAHVARTGRAHPAYGDGRLATAAALHGAGGGDLLAAAAVVCRRLADRRGAA